MTLAGWISTATEMEELLKIDKDAWLKELPGIEEHYAKFGDRLPKELRDELNALAERLKKR